jgi:hypothetical protein
VVGLSTAYLKLGDVQGRPSASRTGDTDGALASYSQSLAPGVGPRPSQAMRRFSRMCNRAGAYRTDPSGPRRSHGGDRAHARGDGNYAAAGARASAELRRDAFRAPLYLGDALFGAGDYDSATDVSKGAGGGGTARLDPPEADFKHRIAVAKNASGSCSWCGAIPLGARQL